MVLHLFLPSQQSPVSLTPGLVVEMRVRHGHVRRHILLKQPIAERRVRRPDGVECGDVHREEDGLRTEPCITTNNSSQQPTAAGSLSVHLISNY